MHEACDGMPSINRSYQPYLYFSDLQASVEAQFFGYQCVLNIPNTPDIVGSQEELLFAYLDHVEDAPILKLQVRLVAEATTTTSRKRDLKDIVSSGEIAVSKRSGPWKNGEVELFRAGVKVRYNDDNLRSLVGKSGAK